MTEERELSPAELRQRSEAATTHGARAPGEIRRVARVQKRRLLRQAGLRAADLDGLGMAFLDNWSRAQAKVELYDRWAAEHGWIDDEGNEPGFVRTYFAALNSARLALGKLGEHLGKSATFDDGLRRLIAEGGVIEQRRRDTEADDA
jgi:hypothetical protein